MINIKSSPNQWWLGSLLSLCLLSGFNTNVCARELDVHDPVISKDGDQYFLYSTGPGITVYSSSDLKSWQARGQVFSADPPWAQIVSPGFNGHMWAPDIVEHKGLYYLYYSVSAFGQNASGIGVTVNKTLNPDSPDYHWQDHGIVVRSIPGRDEWNAIDPQVLFDEQGTPWMSFGSFWRGLKLVKLDPSLTALAQPEQWYTLARRAPPSAVEAPFIYRHGGYYYLFVSWDHCCKGVKSDYKLMVGRAKTITGPYLDKQGKELTEGGGSLLLKGNERWPGLGHNAVYKFDGQEYVVFHAYETADNGLQKLKILTLSWDQAGWPVLDPKELDTFKSQRLD